MGEVALMSPTLPSGTTDSINIFKLEKIWLGKHFAVLSRFFHLSSQPWGRNCYLVRRDTKKLSRFPQEENLGMSICWGRLPPPNSPEPSLISLMFKLAGTSCHILFLPPDHPPSSKFFVSSSHFLVVLFLKTILAPSPKAEGGWGVREARESGLATNGF